MAALYNKIGKTYDATRRADPIITEKLFRHLEPETHRKYLDIACGSGNYTGSLANKGLSIEGIDISEEILSKAKIKYSTISFHNGNATSLPFENNSFHGATCILATHHIQNIDTAFKEAARVIDKGKIVILTATPKQMQNYWLCEYFPNLMEASAKQMSDFETLATSLKSAGFSEIAFDPYFVTNELQDLFLYSGKYRPEIYLDSKVRGGISSFHLAMHANEIQKGLLTLQKDIDSGKIHKIISNYESKIGDYLFITGKK